MKNVVLRNSCNQICHGKADSECYKFCYAISIQICLNWKPDAFEMICLQNAQKKILYHYTFIRVAQIQWKEVVLCSK